MFCTLYYSANIAGIFGILEAIGGLSWNIWILVLFNKIYVEDREWMQRRNYTYEHNEFIDHFRNIPERKGVYSLIIFSTVLHSFWLISSVMLLIGNMIYSKVMLSQWIPVTLMMILTDVLASIYFTLRLGAFLENNSVDDNPAPILLAVFFSRCCLLFVFLNAFLVHYVCRRCLQMAARKYCQKQIRECFEESPMDEHYPQTHRRYVGEEHHKQEHRIAVQQPVFVREEKPAEEVNNGGNP
ncbi:uncharacterized protein [Centruroides vittatus]|uniref:uncharacterized protein isoform X2 n=1 Tax=Centruroides vittatus TaxID=120091 RepID=UPI00351034DE